MAKSERRSGGNRDAALSVRDLQVYYGKSHVLQGVSFDINQGVFAIVGRNGMGKTTLCNAIMGLIPITAGSVRIDGEFVNGLAVHKINALGVSYTPQGRRLWPSLTVDEHLRMISARGAWTRERVYDAFPRLYERQRNNADQLSGGEQQMLSIARALLQDPRVLILDEPTEGLAPVIVSQVEEMLIAFADENDVAVLLIEQNLSVATTVASEVGILVNGNIVSRVPSSDLATDRVLQERLLGVGRHADLDEGKTAEPPQIQRDESREIAPAPTISADAESATPAETLQHASEQTSKPVVSAGLSYQPPTRWSSAHWTDAPGDNTDQAAPETNDESLTELPFDSVPEPLYKESESRRTHVGQIASARSAVVLVGTFDTKGTELNYIKNILLARGVPVQVVDVSTSGKPSSAEVPPHVLASFHPNGSNAVFGDDRGTSVKAMSMAFERWVKGQDNILGMISAGGSGGTSLVTPAMQHLPVGTPKVMISTVASGDVGNYVGPSDIMMMYSVTDIQGLNSISRRVLKNGANAIAGMVNDSSKSDATTDQSEHLDKPSIGLTMFGVTTTAVQQVSAQLEDQYDCLIFHATGTGGRSMEKLVDNRLLESVIDVTTTEICDMIVGGVFAATEDRFGAVIRTGVPYVGSVGALDMVNFGARSTIPPVHSQRLFVEHNASVTLMRTTAAENQQMGAWIASRLNEMPGAVRFLIPENGVSALDAPGQPFHDPEANQALFEALRHGFIESDKHRLISLPHHINDQAFADAVVSNFNDIAQHRTGRNHALA